MVTDLCDAEFPVPVLKKDLQYKLPPIFGASSQVKI